MVNLNNLTWPNFFLDFQCSGFLNFDVLTRGVDSSSKYFWWSVSMLWNLMLRPFTNKITNFISLTNSDYFFSVVVLNTVYRPKTFIFCFLEVHLGKLKLLTKYYDKLWTRKLEVNHSTYEQHILEKFDLWLLRFSGIFLLFLFIFFCYFSAPFRVCLLFCSCS